MRDFVSEQTALAALNSDAVSVSPGNDAAAMFLAGLPLRSPAASEEFLGQLPASGYARLGKRALDIALVVVSLPITLPIIALCALALWIEGGSPFYRQQRLGKERSLFSLLKLRTMVSDADERLEAYLAENPDMRAEWESKQKLKNDPRITPVGAVLRKTSMDELPQIWNILRGEMSIVGPRPMMPDQLPIYGKASAYFALRPGLTGPWQVSDRNDSRFDYRSVVDTLYGKQLSLKTDLQIILRTFVVVLRGTGY